MVSALYDGIFYIGAPILALVLAMALEGLTGPVATTTAFGPREAWLSIFIAVWTAAHLFAVIFRSHCNPQIFQRFKFRFTVVPVLVFAGFFVSDWLLVTGFVLTASALHIPWVFLIPMGGRVRQTSLRSWPCCSHISRGFS